MRWEKTKLGNLFQIKHGWAFKGEYFNSEGELIIVTPGNFLERGGFRQVAGKEKFYTGDFPPEFLLKADDVVIAMTEQGPGLLGSPALIPADEKYLHNQRIGLINQIEADRIFPKFIYYLFFTSTVRNEIFGSATGTKVKHTAPKRIYDIDVQIPSVDTQRKIASILSAYDDLIENNLKRIKLLEEKAFLSYKIMNEELSKSEKINLFDFANVQMGFAFKADAFNEEGEGTPIIRIRDIPKQLTKSYTTQEVDPEYFVEKGDLLIGMDGEFHMDEWLGQRGYLVQRVCRLRSKDPLFQSYLWQALIEPIHYYETTITGATVAHLGKKHLEEIFIIPPTSSMKQQLEEMNSMRKLKINLAEQNAKLREARDILLPRLMSGEIVV